MSMPTPGPWVADDSNVLVGRHVLAIVNDPDRPSHLTEVSKANANLIAAAPELLAVAVQLMVEVLSGQASGNPYMRKSVQLAEAAIAKAGARP